MKKWVTLLLVIMVMFSSCNCGNSKINKNHTGIQESIEETNEQKEAVSQQDSVAISSKSDNAVMQSDEASADEPVVNEPVQAAETMTGKENLSDSKTEDVTAGNGAVDENEGERFPIP